MKVSIVVSQTRDGKYNAEWVGEDVDKGLEVFEKLRASGDYARVAIFRKPPVYKRSKDRVNLADEDGAAPAEKKKSKKGKE